MLGDVGLTITYDISGCLADVVGENGLTPTEYDKWFERATKGAKQLKIAYEAELLPLLRIAERREDIDILTEKFYTLIDGDDEVAETDTVVFLGTGGSSLGGQTIAQMGGWFIPGDDVNQPRKLPRTRIFDNLDPRSLERGIGLLDLKKARFIIISKSGNTAETLLQTITVINAYKEAGLEAYIGRSILGLSEPPVPGGKNGLRDLLGLYNCEFLDHETDIGGRFSCLTNVGLIFAVARGMDPFQLREGAAKIINHLVYADSYDDFMPVLGSTVCVGLYQERHVNNFVMMPYVNQLARFANWYVQLWAESLGKDGVGMTPIAALGPVDQHSQLQLYMDGPIDKLVTIVATETTGKGPFIDRELAGVAGMDFFSDRHVGDLVSAQARATRSALEEANRPTRYIRVSEVNEFTLGQLLMSFMVETILAAGLLNINAFDQPAVEVGKRMARDFLRN